MKTKHSQNAVKKDYGFKIVSGQRGKGYWCEAGARMVERRQIIVQQDHQMPQMSTVQQLGAFGQNARGQYCGEAMHDDIAVTVVFLSIIVEQEEFQLWVEDWYRLLSEYDIIPWEKKRLVRAVGRLLEQYVEQTFDEEYSEQDIRNLYGNAASGFGRITQQTQSGLPIYAQPQQNGFGGGMRNGQFGNGGFAPGNGGFAPGNGMMPGMGSGYSNNPFGQQNPGIGSYSRGTRY